jgi:tricarballylate dehydrogenase
VCKVLLIDRAPEGQHGGNSRWSPCYMRMSAPDQVAPDLEDEVQKVSSGRADRAYFQRLAQDAPATMAWLMRHGVAFHKPVYYLSAGPPRIQPVGGGSALLRALERAAVEAGATVRHGCRAQRLLMGRDGAIEGVEVLGETGKPETVDAQAVVLASGGFAGSSEMLARHLGPGAEALKLIAPGTAFNTGDGIRMALEAGARQAGDWTGMHAEPVDARSRNAASVVLVYPYGIVVDRTGRRFFDEGAGLVHETWETFARAIHFSAPGRIAYAVLDSKLYDIAGYERAIRSEVPPYQAASISELAARIGVAARPLLETVERYNAAAIGDATRFDATRADELAAAASLSPPKSNWCRPIDRPPYIAFPLAGAIAYTFGGVATDEEARVLGEVGPIPGLFAAGEITGHFHGLAPNAVAMLRALVFGRIAGRNAHARLLR